MDSAIPMPDQQARPAVPSAPGDAWRGTFTPPVRPPRPYSRREALRRSLPRVYREPFSRAAWGAAWGQCEYTAIGWLLAIPGFIFIAVAVTVGFGMSLSFAAC